MPIYENETYQKIQQVLQIMQATKQVQTENGMPMNVSIYTDTELQELKSVLITLVKAYVPTTEA